MNAETWNERYPVGTPVVAYPGTRDGKRLKTRTRSKAWELFSGDSVVKVHGRAGGIALTHIDIDAATAADDEKAIQALSVAGAYCGCCDFEPGDRGCPDCETSWLSYVVALRAAGWAPRAEVLAEAHGEVVAWLEKKAREHGAQGKQYAKQAAVIWRLADKVSRGAVKVFPYKPRRRVEDVRADEIGGGPRG